MMTPFEWVVGDSPKDHTVTALPPTAAQPPRYTTLRGTTIDTIDTTTTLDAHILCGIAMRCVRGGLSGLNLRLWIRHSRVVGNVWNHTPRNQRRSRLRSRECLAARNLLGPSSNLTAQIRKSLLTAGLAGLRRRVTPRCSGH